jgi:hypothetical protein
VVGEKTRRNRRPRRALRADYRERRDHDTSWSAITDGTVFDVPGAELEHRGD